MAYIGKAPNTAIVNQTTSQSFNGTGSATAFTLNRSVNVGEDLEVFVNNVQQEPGSGKAYTASGTTLTFSAAPASGTGNIYVIYRGEATINPRLEHDANAALAATTGTFSGAFTSPGIDDNADATAITIDSSENVLIDKTSSNYQTVGHELRNGGRAFHTADGSKTLSLNRLSSDGGILDFYKDNSEVGTIGTSGSQSYIHGAGTDTGLYWGSNNIYPYRSTGLNDNTIDLGQSSKRFKDLYLGGNLYLGGTGSANALDDYEEGTFTPHFQMGLTSPGYSVQQGTYVKIGSLVVCSIYLRANSGTENGDHIYVGGLPFTVITGGSIDHQYGAFFTYNGGFWTSDANTQWLALKNQTNLAFYKQADGGAIQGTTSGVATNLNADLRLVAVYRS
jgi:hypothetical protein